jgi:hypothetical protein
MLVMSRPGQLWEMVLPEGIEPSTSPLPRECSTPELRQRKGAKPLIEGAEHAIGPQGVQLPVSGWKTRYHATYRAQLRARGRTYPQKQECARGQGEVARKIRGETHRTQIKGPFGKSAEGKPSTA